MKIEKEEHFKFNGKRFKSINSYGRKTLVEISKSKSIVSDEFFYLIKVKKVIFKDEMKYLENFTIVRDFGDYCFVENSMLFTEKSFATIIEIGMNHLM